MKDVSFHAGDVVFREDEMQLSMYEVRKGSVGIYLDYGTEQERQLTVLKEKQLFGEMGLLEAAPRSATAVALQDGTFLRVIDEEEFNAFFQDKPELLLQILKQLSARIRENTEKYEQVCRTLAESVKADRSGAEKSTELTRQMESIGAEAKKKPVSYAGLRSSFFAYIQEDLDAYEGKREIVRTSLLERLAVHRLSPEDMHVNPDDEFANPRVGPSDRIINEYVDEIKMMRDELWDIFPQPIVVYKMKPEGYLILNGHHRWAAALKSGLRKVRATIMNPPKE